MVLHIAIVTERSTQKTGKLSLTGERMMQQVPTSRTLRTCMPQNAGARFGAVVHDLDISRVLDGACHAVLSGWDFFTILYTR